MASKGANKYIHPVSKKRCSSLAFLLSAGDEKWDQKTASMSY